MDLNELLNILHGLEDGTQPLDTAVLAVLAWLQDVWMNRYSR